MSKIENIDTKILIDVLKYTSNIIIDITNKLSEQENKINKMENTLTKIQNSIDEFNSKIMLSNKSSQKNNNLKHYINHDKITLKNDFDCDFITSFLKEKNNEEYINKKVNSELKDEKNDNILNNKHKIDKLINTIIKKKNTYEAVIENNKEKSLLTDYNIIETNKVHNEKSNDDIVTNINLDHNKKNNNNDIINVNTNVNNVNTNNIKNIRKKGNFARKF